MVYVDNTGSVRDQRPIWTPSGLYYLIVSFFNFIILFFRSLVDPTLTKYGRNVESTNYRTGGGGGGGGGGRGGRFDRKWMRTEIDFQQVIPPNARPGRRMGGFGGTGGGPGCAPMAGG
ncbi:unnamed protein product [Rotaria sp. Silwood1]|nr:unnamed protein product [Rotaria sp. Silwood1]CAF4717838.1 unnamed protein product [Rotaria sp. Silwood1]CAF4747899.1 unnamed protein product [Rotaria sp. Silwood1]